MAKHNIKYVVFGLLNDQGKLITGDQGLSQNGIYIADHAGEGATKADYSDVEANGDPKYANGAVKRMSYGKSQVKLALTMLDMDFATKQKIKGWVSDKNNGWTQHFPKPHVAVLTVAEAFDGDYIIEALANAETVEAASSNSTDTNSSADSDDSLTLNGLDPLDKTKFADAVDPTKNVPYKIWKSATENNPKIYAEVFPGYDATGSSEPVAQPAEQVTKSED